MGSGRECPMPKTSREETEEEKELKRVRRKKMAAMCAELSDWWNGMSKEEWDEVDRDQTQATLDVNRDYIERGMVREAINEEHADEKAVYRCEWEY